MPYGKIIREYANTGVAEKYLLTGKERDQETGYDKYDHRSYDSDIARWISPDVLHAKAPGGKSGNAINGVGPNNKKAGQYLKASKKEFGGR
jgi:RHS repeat-associated protein